VLYQSKNSAWIGIRTAVFFVTDEARNVFFGFGRKNEARDRIGFGFGLTFGQLMIK